MSRFRKLSHTVWHCQYHIVWVPKYRLRILEGEIAIEVSRCIRAFSEQKGCEVVELNIQMDQSKLLKASWTIWAFPIG
jgi:putative transposase